MHGARALMAIAVILGSAQAAMAAGAVSANGFSCTQESAGGNRTLVECTGQFPGVAGIFAATGFDMVHVEYSPDNRKRYFYMSETGCLVLNASDNTALATDRAGQKKQFPAYLDAMNWCYTGGRTQPAPAPQQQQQPPKPQPGTSQM